MQHTLSFEVNGRPRSVTTHPRRPLLDVLREDLELTGAKFGCGDHQCGACTVLVGGRPVFACVTPVTAAQGKSVETIEGLADGERLHPLQQAFLDEGVAQCGYCTPGMIMNAVRLLRDNPRPTTEEIGRQMQRNVCRCGTYGRIIRAVERAAANGEGGQS